MQIKYIFLSFFILHPIFFFQSPVGESSGDGLHAFTVTYDSRHIKRYNPGRCFYGHLPVGYWRQWWQWSIPPWREGTRRHLPCTHGVGHTRQPRRKVTSIKDDSASSSFLQGKRPDMIHWRIPINNTRNRSLQIELIVSIQGWLSGRILLFISFFAQRFFAFDVFHWYWIGWHLNTMIDYCRHLLFILVLVMRKTLHLNWSTNRPKRENIYFIEFPNTTERLFIMKYWQVWFWYRSLTSDNTWHVQR